ncbi:YfhO family protein [Carnobacteriaceae bacterium zg-ZUI240]|nr:YfhO family protein [Carnobacteriaceae bacterium zg-ZUI240]
MNKQSIRQIYILCAVIPLAIMIVNFIILGMYPFGNTTVMAIDFASQYIDLFAYLKRAVLSLDVDSFFYSFSKSLGGDMVGLWGYYLLSPFNLIYVLLPFEALRISATLTILARYSAMGLTFGHLLIKRYNGLRHKPLLIPIFATLYALSGFAIAYQMNPLWYDALVFLPLIIIGVEQVMDGRKNVYHYVLLLGAMIIMQYYMAYMMCLFIILYALFYATRLSFGNTIKQKLVSYFKPLLRLAIWSLVAVGISAIILYPVVQNLLITKGTYTEVVRFQWAFEFNPLEIISKLFIGAFDYDQMPAGLPNVYVGAVALIGLMLYFSNQSIQKSERFAAFFVLLVFVLSMVHDFTNKIWHLGQTPAWFYHRFTYLTCFFMVLLAYRGVVGLQKLSKRRIIGIVAVLLGFMSSALTQQHSFMTLPQQLLSMAFWLVALLLLVQISKERALPLILLFTVAELGVNANIVQSRIGYAHAGSFLNAYSVQKEVIDKIRPDNTQFYRTAKLFNRTKNDPFMFDFPGLTNFSSTMEASTLDLFDYFGDAGANAATNYGNGTALTDALFSVKYIVQMRNLPVDLQNDENIYAFTRESTRKDLNAYYHPTFESSRLRVYQNDNVLPIGFASSDALVNLRMERNAPAYNQNQVLNALQPSDTKYFEQFAFSNITLDNFETDNPNNLSSVTLKRIDKNRTATITYRFTPQTNEAYYISLPASTNLSKNDITFELNGQVYEYYRTYDQRQLFNVAYGNKGEPIEFKISTSSLDELTIYNVQLWRLNEVLTREAIAKTKENGLTVTQWSDNRIEGTITLSSEQTHMMTSIPYSPGWKAYVDDKEVNTRQVWNSLLAVPMTSGMHTVKLVYTPIGWWIGVSVTAASLAIVGIYTIWERRKNDSIL